jgi:outer membrane protein OmpA-like peptidoglycan-associated protein
LKEISKKYIYIPTYFIFVALCCFGLYYLLTRPNIKAEQKKIPVITPVIEKAEPAITSCFKNNQKQMDGLMSIVPVSALNDVLSAFSDECSQEVCTQFERLGRKELTYERMIQNMKNGDCLDRIYRQAIDYHNDVLSKESVIGMFFDEGSSQLSMKQKSKLKIILNTYRVRASDYNLLVIGRASASGNPESNKALSLQRVKAITNYSDALMDGEMQTDYVYFGSELPRLNLNLAELYHIDREDYEEAKTSQSDKDFTIRLNQSVLVVIYDKDEDPFGTIN